MVRVAQCWLAPSKSEGSIRVGSDAKFSDVCGGKSNLCRNAAAAATPLEKDGNKMGSIIGIRLQQNARSGQPRLLKQTEPSTPHPGRRTGKQILVKLARMQARALAGDFIGPALF